MKWQIVTLAVLTVALIAVLVSRNLFPGMFAALFSNAVTTQEVAINQSDEPPIAEETKVFDGVTPIGVKLSNGSAVAVGTGSLKSPTQITLKTFENRPEGGAPRSTAIGLRTVVELPFSQLDLSNPMTNSLFVYAPAFDGAYEKADHAVQEVAISVAGGKRYVFLDSYIPDFPVIFTPSLIELVTSIFSDRSGTLRVSVQPIDAGGILPDPSDSDELND